MKNISLIIYAIIALLFIGCTKENSSVNTSQNSSVDVYIAGSVNDFGEGYDVCYWKNGLKVSLPYASPGFVTSMCASGSDVYIAAGMENSLHTTDTAVYWKNGIQVQYSSPAWATGIAVSGNDVYMSGTYWDAYAYYWKNGIKTILGTGSVAQGIAVSDTDVYVLSNTAAYWKNGVLHTLVASSRPFATAIAVSGNNVYVTGHMGDTAVYWKNGIPNILATGATALAIAVSGNDVYIAGTILAGGNIAVYWKNGVLVNLKIPVLTQDPGFLLGIAVSGNDVYVVGNQQADGPLNTNAVYWKNGEFHSFGSGIANAIALVKR